MLGGQAGEGVMFGMSVGVFGKFARGFPGSNLQVSIQMKLPYGVFVHSTCAAGKVIRLSGEGRAWGWEKGGWEGRWARRRVGGARGGWGGEGKRWRRIGMVGWMIDEMG